MERYVLRKLSESTDIIVTKADKGRSIVIMDVESYIEECERQLNGP